MLVGLCPFGDYSPCLKGALRMCLSVYLLPKFCDHRSAIES